MTRLNSKLVLKTAMIPHGSGTIAGFEIVKTVNTLEHGIPGDELSRETVDKILVSANNRGPRNRLTVEFIK